MLELKVVLSEEFDESTSTFREGETFALDLEHSLVSMSKWESHFEKPFMASDKTGEELLWYIRAMTLTQRVPENVFLSFSDKNIAAINTYISAKMTATWFVEDKSTPNTEVITTEIIYYWMIALQIPFECQYWHINRLLTLVQVCSRKNAKPKKMSSEEVARRNRELNEQRKAQYKTTG